MQIRSRVQHAMKLAELRSIEAGEPERWSVRRLAKAAGVDPGTVQAAIHRPESCTVASLAKLAAVLNCGIADLVEVDLTAAEPPAAGANSSVTLA